MTEGHETPRNSHTRPARRPDVRGGLLAAARVAVPVLYAAGFYAAALYLPTSWATVVMCALVLGSCAWLMFALRMPDDEHRASHLALHAFVAKVLVLPVELVSLMVYAAAALSAGVSFATGTWLLSGAAMYLGVLGASAFVVAGAREAHAAGAISRGWTRALTVCALVPALDIVAAVALWFCMLHARLLGQ